MAVRTSLMNGIKVIPNPSHLDNPNLLVNLLNMVNMSNVNEFPGVEF